MRRTITVENGVQYLNDGLIDTVPAIRTFTASDTTPSVAYGKYYATDTGTLTITNFDEAEAAGKHIVILVLGTVTFAHDATKIDCPDDTDLACTAGDVVEALYYGDVWYIWQVRDADA